MATLALNTETLELTEAPSNVYRAGHLTFEASFDRVLIVEDEFRSGYECDHCNKTGKLDCPDCVDGFSTLNKNIQCKTCSATKHIECPECNGKGAVIVIPETSQRRPTTGTIVSLGSDVKGYKLGESVCYPNFCGETWTLPGIDFDGVERTVELRIMKEREILCKITGQLSVKRMKNHASQISG